MTLPQSDFEALLERAAEKGARRALADVGLDGEHAAEDVRDLRSLLAALRLVRTTAIQTAVRMIVTGVLLILVAGLAIRLKLFDGGS
jgi:2-keto-3-deoxy-L-rhamnonate aldolase RhmA